LQCRSCLAAARDVAAAAARSVGYPMLWQQASCAVELWQRASSSSGSWVIWQAALLASTRPAELPAARAMTARKCSALVRSSAARGRRKEAAGSGAGRPGGNLDARRLQGGAVAVRS
jgi:hypothetical protein